MPPWRTSDDTRAGSRPVSLATIASASSADLRCCASKSAGTYSASITGVSGMMLIRRTEPPDCVTNITAVARAGLASSGSERSTGTRICLYMAAAHSQQDSETTHHHATFGRGCEPGQMAGPPSILSGLDEARGDEGLEASAAGGELAPAVVGKIDHDEARGRQSLVELMRLAATVREQATCHVIQTRVVADHQERGCARIRGLDGGQDGFGAAFIEAILVVDRHDCGKRRSHALPGLARALRGRHQDPVG